MLFQSRLYHLRRARGISQEELAGIVGVSRQAVQKWESGASRPDMDNLAALGRYFGVSLDYLITGAEREPPQQDAPPIQTVYLPGWHYEYKSRRTLFGLPLIHINLGQGGVHWARGVIAVGNLATGLLLAAGGLSTGLVSLGGVSLGLLALGGVAAGVLSALGGVALSFGLAVGGAAIGGAYAMGGAATASQIAAGGAASAHIAIGDAVEGAVTFPKEGWGPGTSTAIQAVILREYPGTPPLLVWLFSQVP